MSALNGVGATMSIQQIMDMRDNIINRSNALQDIHGLQGASAISPGNSAAAAPAGGFEETLRGIIGTVNAAQTRAEEAGNAYQLGEETDVARVMLARQEAGIAFEATLQVRNKLLSAYQDIMRMGV